jgi:hypothetical protein
MELRKRTVSVYIVSYVEFYWRRLLVCDGILSTGKTAHFAATHSCYHLIGGHPQNLYQALSPEQELAAELMHAGYLWWIICFPFGYVLFCINFVYSLEKQDGGDNGTACRKLL